MKRWQILVVALVGILLLSAPPLLGWSGASGYHATIALFQSHIHPDIPFEEFAAGRLGIIQPAWDRSYLYVAYRYMVGPGFDAGEQEALVSMWNERLGVELAEPASQWANAGNRVNNDIAIAIRLGRASTAWIAARNKVPGVDKIDSIDVYRSTATGNENYYANCYDGAFLAAVHTLDAMIEKFGLSSPQVEQWTEAQDQVFDNCSSPNFASDFDAWSAAINEWNQARRQVPDVPPMPSLTGNCKAKRVKAAAAELNATIAKLGASNLQMKQWVEAQDKALVECSKPPAGPPGPEIPQPLKSGTAFERAQRTYHIACANFYSGNFDAAVRMFGEIASDPASPWRQLAPYLVARATIRKATLSSEKNDHKLLAQAEAQLNQIIATSTDDRIKRYARQLLGFVAAQLHPVERRQELAHAVMLRTSDDVLRQDVSDYVWMFDHGPANNYLPTDDLTDWITTIQGLARDNGDIAGPLTHSLDKWKSTSMLPWLVAAISAIHPSDRNAPILLEAAAKVRPSSPAFVTVTYHASRLLIGLGKTDEAREKLDAMLARRDQPPRSTVNQIAALRMGIARNLTEMLTDAPRTPLGITDDGDFEELPSQLDDPNLKQAAAGPLFDQDGADALKRWLPLSELMQVVRSPTLPARLRAPVALATFVRAILLEDAGAAQELAPLVAQSFPQLKPSIDAWARAQGRDARHFAAAFMMLRNPGLRFYVDPGPGRITPLDQIDSLRDNWWPSRVGEQNLKTPNYPSFLLAAEKKTADQEWQKLSAINAPNFLCSEAIDQAKSQPGDPRAPEALYRCLRAVHLGCSNSEGTTLAHSAFIMLHRRYSKSEWADKGKLWYKGGGCSGS